MSEITQIFMRDMIAFYLFFCTHGSVKWIHFNVNIQFVLTGKQDKNTN